MAVFGTTYYLLQTKAVWDMLSVLHAALYVSVHYKTVRAIYFRYASAASTRDEHLGKKNNKCSFDIWNKADSCRLLLCLTKIGMQV